jgi:transposase-like protein
MTPRYTCPHCGKSYQLDKAGRIRRHLRWTRIEIVTTPEGRFYRTDSIRVSYSWLKRNCAGSRMVVDKSTEPGV